MSSRFTFGWVFANALNRSDFPFFAAAGADLPGFFRSVDGSSFDSGLRLDVAKASEADIFTPDFAAWICVLCEAVFEDGVAFDVTTGGLAPVRRYGFIRKLGKQRVAHTHLDIRVLNDTVSFVIT